MKPRLTSREPVAFRVPHLDVRTPGEARRIARACARQSWPAALYVRAPGGRVERWTFGPVPSAPRDIAYQTGARIMLGLARVLAAALVGARLPFVWGKD